MALYSAPPAPALAFSFPPSPHARADLSTALRADLSTALRWVQSVPREVRGRLESPKPCQGTPATVPRMARAVSPASLLQVQCHQFGSLKSTNTIPQGFYLSQDKGELRLQDPDGHEGMPKLCLRICSGCLLSRTTQSQILLSSILSLCSMLGHIHTNAFLPSTGERTSICSSAI